MTGSHELPAGSPRLYQATFLTWGEPIMLVAGSLNAAAILLERGLQQGGAARMLLMDVTDEWLALSVAAQRTRDLLVAREDAFVTDDVDQGWRIVTRGSGAT